MTHRTDYTFLICYCYLLHLEYSILRRKKNLDKPQVGTHVSLKKKKKRKCITIKKIYKITRFTMGLLTSKIERTTQMYHQVVKMLLGLTNDMYPKHQYALSYMHINCKGSVL